LHPNLATTSRKSFYSIFFLLLNLNLQCGFQKLKDLRFGPAEVEEQNAWQRPLNQAIWLISTARNIIVVVACAALASVFHKNGFHPFILTGEPLNQHDQILTNTIVIFSNLFFDHFPYTV
jgi:hypothetical protein